MRTSPEPVLCVDLDGTLIAGDTLLISVRLAARRSPWLLAGLPLALLRGRPALKRYLACRILPDPATLPWRAEVVDFIRSERTRGREICLVTAADRLVAESVAAFLPLFDRVIATDGAINLKAARKVDAIRNALSGKEFDYIGDSRADLPVFAAARNAYLVAPSPSLRRAVETQRPIARIFARDPALSGPSPPG